MVSNNTFSCLQCSHVAKTFLWVLNCSQHVLLQNIEMRPCRTDKEVIVPRGDLGELTAAVVPHLVTEEHWFHVELSVALVTGQPGRVSGATFC